MVANKKRRTYIIDLNESENDEENEDSRDNMSIDKNIQRIPNPLLKITNSLHTLIFWLCVYNLYAVLFGLNTHFYSMCLRSAV